MDSSSFKKANSSLSSQYDLKQFKQQAFVLLKRQSQKLKQFQSTLLTKDQQINIKHQQIKFLKDTIICLENDNQVLIQEKNQLKSKLDNIVKEITNYNTNVVQKIYQQNNQLKSYIQHANQLKQNNQNKLQHKNDQISTLQQQLNNKSCQTNDLEENLKQNKIKSLQYQQKLSSQSIQNTSLTNQITKLNDLVYSKQQKIQKCQFQISTLTKQLNSLISKHNQTTKQYQLKIKELHSSMIQKSQLGIYQNLVKSKENQINNLKTTNSHLNKKYQELRKQYLNIKQTSIQQSSKLKLKIQQNNLDLINLNKSIQLQRKIIEFQSQDSQTFYQIYQKYYNLKEQNQQHRSNIAQLQQKKLQCQKLVQNLKQSLSNLQCSQQLLKTQFQHKLNRLQSSSQSKLISLTIKIRTQQEALQKLRKRQIQTNEQNQQLRSNLQNEKQQFLLYKQTMEHSFSKLNKQNYQLLQQLRQLTQLCQQNIDSKQVLDKLKYVLNHLLTALHYCQLLMIRNRQKQRKLYMPYINFFHQISNKLNHIVNSLIDKKKITSDKSNQKIYKPKSKYLLKLKAAIWTIIAGQRISKLRQNRKKDSEIHMSGINFKVTKGVQRRNKIGSLNKVLEKQTQILMSKQSVQQIVWQLVEKTANSFSWSQPNYRKIQLNIQKYQSILNLISQVINRQ